MSMANPNWALCRFDHVVGDDGEVVDFHYSFDLGEEPFEEPEVAAGDTGDRGDGLSVGEVVGVEHFAKVLPVAL